MLNLLILDPSVAVGFVFIVAVVVRWILVPADARRSEYMLVIALGAVILSPAAQAIADRLSGLRPMKMDLYAYGLDRYLGEPAFVLGRGVTPHMWAKVVLNVAYGLLPMAVVFVLTSHIARRRAGVGHMVWAFVLNLALAPVFYLMFPVCGPRFAFPGFPLEPGLVLPHMVHIDAAPNGVPSVHMSTALLVLWFSRKRRAAMAMAGVYGLLIVAATLASGQHYAVDLLAAVPYAAGILWLTKAKRPWSRTGGEEPAVAAASRRDAGRKTLGGTREKTEAPEGVGRPGLVPSPGVGPTTER